MKSAREWEVVGECERLWERVGGCGRVREIVGESGRLWESAGDCGRVWEVVGECGREWEVVGVSGRVWERVGEGSEECCMTDRETKGGTGERQWRGSERSAKRRKECGESRGRPIDKKCAGKIIRIRL
jgi:hypothetical protein